MRIFLSHSSADHALAEEICRDLEKEGYGCFIAPRDIRSGHEYAEELVNGIDSCEMMLLLLSKQANESPHVLREIERAVSKNKTIIVYKLEDVVLSKSMEYFLMTHQWLDMRSGKDHREIIEAIKQYSDGGMLTAAAAEKKKYGKNKYTVLIIACALVVLSAAAAAALNIRQNNAVQEESVQETAEPSASENAVTSVSAVTAAPSEEAEENSAYTTVSPAASTAQPEAPHTAASSSETGFSTAVQDETEPAVSEPPEPAEEPDAFSVSLTEGESLFFGEYNGSPIEWRVIHISDDAKSAVVISDKILTMKAFDAAEGGEYNFSGGENYWRTATDDISPELQRTIRGDNRWEYSNIRIWLNSAREMVRYDDCPPASSAMSEHDNGYNTEAGFLNGFTEDELSVIAETTLATNGSVTCDRVFLLSSDEIQWLYDSDVSIYAQPTPQAIEQDTSDWYDVNLDAYNTKEHFWWLRDADSSNACKVHMVNISRADSLISTQCAGLEGFGIRPAVTIDLTAAALPEIMENSNGTN